MATTSASQAPAGNQSRRRGLIVSVSLNVVLFLLACGLALYAFMLHVDLDEVKRRLSKEVETRQQAERYRLGIRGAVAGSTLAEANESRAIVKQRLEPSATLYETLQILRPTMFETTRLNQLLDFAAPATPDHTSSNQLNLYES